MEDNGTGLTNKEATGALIQAAIAVHKALGPGFLESFYEEAFCIELACRRIPYERQKPVRLLYRGQPIGEHRLDLLVASRIVIELKAIRELEPVHFAIVRSYMKATGSFVGLLFNFATMPLTIKRVGREWHLPDFLSSKSDSGQVP
jgi:GxxExxY protein